MTIEAVSMREMTGYRLVDAPRRPWVKICGATRPADIDLLSRAGVDLVGLWHSVPSGHAELDIGRLAALAHATATTQLRPVLGTLLPTAPAVREVLSAARLSWVQLHGYQTPGTVHALKSADAGLRVIKVLHLCNGDCPERPLIRAYEGAGVDYFLLDSVTKDGRLGSTAQALDLTTVLTFADLVNRPFLLAGGITADRAAQLREVSSHPRFFGVDVDTGARTSDQHFDRTRIANIRRAWRSPNG